MKYLQVGEEYGGTLSLVLGEIYEKYFDSVKDYLAQDNETVGKYLVSTFYGITFLSSNFLRCFSSCKKICYDQKIFISQTDNFYTRGTKVLHVSYPSNGSRDTKVCPKRQMFSSVLNYNCQVFQKRKLQMVFKDAYSLST